MVLGPARADVGVLEAYARLVSALPGSRRARPGSGAGIWPRHAARNGAYAGIRHALGEDAAAAHPGQGCARRCRRNGGGERN